MFLLKGQAQQQEIQTREWAQAHGVLKWQSFYARKENDQWNRRLTMNKELQRPSMAHICPLLVSVSNPYAQEITLDVHDEGAT